MAKSPARLMSAALKKELVPGLKALGFEGTFPNFERDAEAGRQLVSVLYHPSGGEFLLEFGVLPEASRPEEIALSARLATVSVLARARLLTESGRWFNFKRYGADEDAYQGLAGSVSGLLPQIEQWFASGVNGPNVRCVAL